MVGGRKWPRPTASEAQAVRQLHCRSLAQAAPEARACSGSIPVLRADAAESEASPGRRIDRRGQPTLRLEDLGGVQAQLVAAARARQRHFDRQAGDCIASERPAGRRQAAQPGRHDPPDHLHHRHSARRRGDVESCLERQLGPGGRQHVVARSFAGYRTGPGSRATGTAPVGRCAPALT